MDNVKGSRRAMLEELGPRAYRFLKLENPAHVAKTERIAVRRLAGLLTAERDAHQTVSK